MAGTNVVNNLQLGDSSIPTRNFVWQTNNDGSAKLARGNVGATTQDILTVDQNGRVAFPQSVVAFSAYRNTTQALPASTFTKLLINTEEFDTGSGFDTGTSRFQPTVAGYYQISGTASVATSECTMIISIYKSTGGGAAVEAKRGVTVSNSAASTSVSALVYLNGSTDYVELWLNIGVAQNISSGAPFTYFQGILVAKA
ncbi:hypothetical protein UFOVP580_13 [uncultured Caudovirales phage]|uniref:C1q domain-containing protein n=1 Tax=uncultured Caudovirales phage TaxID=2100421 RepID=A0A6J5PM22_9CAUD|nr:hypothetical protein UFOVP580_13 [uncultured Caudovirales phage]